MIFILAGAGYLRWSRLLDVRRCPHVHGQYSAHKSKVVRVELILECLSQLLSSLDANLVTSCCVLTLNSIQCAVR